MVVLLTLMESKDETPFKSPSAKSAEMSKPVSAAPAIRALDQTVVNRIAAGEVIVRLGLSSSLLERADFKAKILSFLFKLNE